MNGHYWVRRGLSFAVAFAFVLTVVEFSHAAVQCFSLEFFYDSTSESDVMLRTAFEEITAQQTGLTLLFHDVSQDEDQKNKKRIDSIAKYFSLAELKLPAIYGLRHVVADLKSKGVMQRRLKEILTMTAFVRNGCPHCRDAKAFLRKYRSRYPALTIVYREVTTDPNARNDMNALVSRYRRSAASLPVIHFCNGLSIGFDREATTGRRILQKLDYWSRTCPDKNQKPTE